MGEQTNRPELDAAGWIHVKHDDSEKDYFWNPAEKIQTNLAYNNNEKGWFLGVDLAWTHKNSERNLEFYLYNNGRVMYVKDRSKNLPEYTEYKKDADYWHRDTRPPLKVGDKVMSRWKTTTGKVSKKKKELGKIIEIHPDTTVDIKFSDCTQRKLGVSEFGITRAQRRRLLSERKRPVIERL